MAVVLMESNVKVMRGLLSWGNIYQEYLKIEQGPRPATWPFILTLIYHGFHRCREQVLLVNPLSSTFVTVA